MRKITSIVVASGTGLLLLGGAFSTPAFAASHELPAKSAKVSIRVDADKNTATVDRAKGKDLKVSWTKVDGKRSKVVVKNEAGKVVRTKVVPTKVLDRVEAAADDSNNRALRHLLDDLRDHGGKKADRGDKKAEDRGSKKAEDRGGKKAEKTRPVSDGAGSATLPNDELNDQPGDDDQNVAVEAGDDNGQDAAEVAGVDDSGHHVAGDDSNSHRGGDRGRTGRDG